MSHNGRRSTFIVHNNMTVTLNKPGGTHQTASMAERYGHTQQPGHRSHHVCSLPGPHGPRTGPTPRASASSDARKLCAKGLRLEHLKTIKVTPLMCFRVEYWYTAYWKSGGFILMIHRAWLYWLKLLSSFRLQRKERVDHTA